MAAGLRARMDARVQRSALQDAGLLEPGLARVFDQLESSGQQIADAGASKMQADLVGSLLDVLA